MRSEIAVVRTVSELRAADAAASHFGVSGTTLMENAGRAVARHLARRFPGARRIAVLCGPGNNGGDGFVAARYLANEGREVRVVLLGERSRLAGDAAWAASEWHGAVTSAETMAADDTDVVVDALFGAGLSRPLGVGAEQALAQTVAAGVPVVAVDVPSGVHGDTGRVLGAAAPAALTVTFAAKKPAHLLMPARALCGDIAVVDIGLPASAFAGAAETCWQNVPGFWLPAFPRLSALGHKYGRGHTLVVSGPAYATGAARLAARAALRAGAGLVTICGARDALAEHAAQVTAMMLREVRGAADLGRVLDDVRYTTVVIGPGAGITLGTRAKVIEALERHRATVLDADALTVFEGETKGLADLVRGSRAPVVITPHEGEFSRLFKGVGEVLDSESKLERARAAARLLGVTVALKGPDTVVAAADGRATIAANAPPTLATAGAGDVLAGFVAGLLAQGMPPFEAASAAVWLHGEAAAAFGPGLTADDLPGELPGVLRRLAVT